MTARDLLAELGRRGIRLWADGGRLRFDAPKGVFTDELRERVRAGRDDLLAVLEEGAPGPLTLVSRDGPLPLSFGQQRLWFLDQLAPDDLAYTVPAAVHLRGPLEPAIMARALGEIVARHETLRSRMPSAGGRAELVIGPPAPVALEPQSLEHLPAGARLDEATARARACARQPFDLAAGPLFRVDLWRLGSQEHVLQVVMHHIISDGWSMGVFFRELSALYGAFLRGEPSPLPPLPLQYVDHAARQQRVLEAGSLRADLDWWARELDDLPTLELPLDRPRRGDAGHRGAFLWFPLDDALRDDLQRLARRENATRFQVMLAAFLVVLQRHTGQDDLVVGTPIAGRGRREIEGLIGFFVNNLVLRGDVSGDPTFRELLGRVRATVLDAFAHQDTPFEKIVEAVAPERELGKNPLFQVLFNHFDLSDLGYDLPPLEMTSLDMTLDVSKFDLTLHCFEKGELLVAKLEYDTDLFDQETVRALGEHYVNVLRGVVRDPGGRLSRLPLLSDAERRRLLVELDRGAAPTLPAASVGEAFARRAAAAPDAPALACDGVTLTAGGLLERADAVARALVARGLGPEDRVALHLDRSAEMIVGLLGILRAGAAYVPIEATTPDERVAFLLEDAGCRAVFSAASPGPGWPADLEVLPAAWLAGAVEAHPDVALPSVAPGSLAYVIHTSGSTGTPKGVEVEHRQLLHYLAGIGPRLDVPAGGVFATVSTLAADLGHTAIFPALCGAGEQGAGHQGAGCLVVLTDAQIRDGDAFAAAMAEQRVDVLKIVPSHLRALLDAAADPAAVLPRRLLVTGGEALTWELVDRIAALAPDLALMNHYGPAEATVGALTHRLAPGDRERFPLAPPLGRPLPGVRAYVVDPRGEPVPAGVPGELWIAGGGVTRGYHGRPELTAAAYGRDPFRRSGEGRVYRTGDRVRRDRDGVLHFGGRVDDQVKVRGHRVEPGEVARVIEAHDAVGACAVVADRDAFGNTRLVAYVTPAADAAARAGVGSGSGTGADPATGREADAPVDTADVRRFAEARLPGHMVPAAWVSLAALPLTANGKLDRKALPAPGFDRETLAGDFVAPRTDAERTLAAIWCDVLRLPRVGVHDDFFELGGESILSIQIVSRANQAGLALRPRDVFERSTIAELAAVAGAADGPAAEQGPVTGPVPLTPVQRRFFDAGPAEPDHYNHAVLLRSKRALDEAVLRAACADLAEHHDALRARFTREATDGAPDAWRQELLPPGGEVPVEVVDLAGRPADERRAALEARAAEAQASLDIAAGPLWRAVLFRLGEGESDRLLLVVHHLVIDGVSWHVLLDDLAAALEARAQGRAPALPPKTSSWKTWAEALAARAAGPAVLRGARDWLTEARRDVAPLPLDTMAAELAPEDLAAVNVAAAAETLEVSLDEEQTTRLLRTVPRAYRTQVNDVLLTALARAAEPWTGSPHLLVDLEGHGREDELLGVDTSRTVGWFTSVHPVLLELPRADDGGADGSADAGDDHGRADPGRDLCAVKEQLRSVPGRGFDWGLLRRLAPPGPDVDALRALPAAQIGFNHMGQVDQPIEDSGGFGRAPESPGLGTGLANRRHYLLDVGGSLAGGRLHVSWTFCTAVHDRATIEALAARFLDELRAIITHATPTGQGGGGGAGCTLSDFPLARMNADELAAVVARHGAADIEDLYVATPLQRGMLFHSLAEPDAGTYVTQFGLTLRGELDAARFRGAWQSVVDAHPVLRTAFVTEGLDEFHQVVCRRAPLRWDEQDWSDRAPGEQATALAALADDDRAGGLDLGTPPLMRLRLIALGRDGQGVPRHRLIWTHHHALLDGWSLPLLVQDVFGAYRGTPPPPRRPFLEAVRWIEAQDRAAGEAHWRALLDGWSEPTPLPAGRAGASDAGAPAANDAPPAERAVLGRAVDASTSRALSALARREHLTLNTLVQGAWALLLAGHSGRDEVLFGATVSGRPPELPGVESMLGLFINTLPVRVAVDDEPLLPWLHALQDQLVALQDHVATPLYEVQRQVSGAGRGGAPLFESLVVFENYPVAVSEPVDAAGLTIDEAVDVSHATYPLALVAQPGPRLNLQLRYDTARFAAADARRLLERLQGLLAALATRPEARLSSLSLLTDDERRRQLVEWNATAGSYPRDASVPALFAAAERATPEAPAVEFGEELLTYAELGARARRLARHLAERGVQPGHRVALRLERGTDLVVGFLAVLQCGAAYVPLDPDHPDRRAAFMLEDAGAALLITRGGGDGLGTDVPVLDLAAEAAAIAVRDDGPLDARPDGGPGPLDPAYVIYTSGSTGTPKGVVVPHRAIARLVLGTDYCRLSPGDRVAQASNASFDAATFEIWGALLNGATLVGLGTDELLEPERLGLALRARRVGTLFVTTALFNRLVSQVPDIFGTLDCLLFGGEAVTVRWVREALAAGAPRRLCHVYGPTECTTFSTWHEVHGPDGTDLPEDATTIPIGRPIAHSTAYVLDGHGRPVPPGTPGGLYLGGDGLALGYHERPELTAERFVPHPFASDGAACGAADGAPDGGRGRRLYRTGDVVVQRDDGALIFAGRDDHQVKLRGFRIELGEVEAALRAQPGVHDVCVVLREDRPGDKQLVAYVVPEAGPPQVDEPEPDEPEAEVPETDAAGAGAPDGDLRGELRAALSADLPAYMVPTAMVLMEALPLTVNGKVDRAALPAPAGRPVAAELVPPASGLQTEVAALWCEVLGLDAVGATDDFFELGGHSLLATQLLNRIGKRYAPVSLPLRALFDHPTVAGLAAQLEAAGVAADRAPPSGPDPAGAHGHAGGGATPGDRTDARTPDGPVARDAGDDLPDADTVGDLSDAEVEALLRKLSGEPEPRE